MTRPQGQCHRLPARASATSAVRASPRLRPQVVAQDAAATPWPTASKRTCRFASADPGSAAIPPSAPAGHRPRDHLDHRCDAIPHTTAAVRQAAPRLIASRCRQPHLISLIHGPLHRSHPPASAAGSASLSSWLPAGRSNAVNFPPGQHGPKFPAQDVGVRRRPLRKQKARYILRPCSGAPVPPRFRKRGRRSAASPRAFPAVARNPPRQRRLSPWVHQDARRGAAVREPMATCA